MSTYDSDITLIVNVEAGDVKATAADIQKRFAEIFKQTSGEALSSEFNRAKISAAHLYNEMSKITAEMNTLETTKFETDEFKALSEEFDKVDHEYNELVRSIKDLNVDPDSNHTYRNTMDEMLDKLETLQSKMDQLKESGKADYAGVDTPEYTALAAKLADVTNKASEVRDKLNALNVEFNYTAQAEAPVITYGDILRQSFSELASHIGFTNGKFGGFTALLKGVGATIGGAAANFKKFGSGVLSTIGNLSKFVKSLKNATAHTNRHNTALQMGFKNFIRYGLGVRSLFALINKLRRALMEGLGNLAQYSSPFNAVMSQFVSSLATLQNAFATAFAPVLTVVLPILSALMDALIRVITLIGQFFAALTGKGTFVQAKRVNKDYAGSLAGVGKSAGGASKGMNKANKSAKELERTISGFDDVEILHENKPTSSGSGGGSGGGGGGVGGLNPNDMFETVEIESPIADMANRIRELIANQDWEGLGVFLGEAINSVFRKAKELISWDNLGERITFVINAITTTINSMVDTIDWDLIGSTFAEGINTLIKTINLILTSIHWGTIGKKLAIGLNALFRDINWEELGLVFANGFNSIFDFLYNLLSEFDWKQAASSLTTALNTFIQKTDWKKVGKTFSELLKGALQFLFQALATFDWVGLGKMFLDLLLGIDWAGLLSVWYSGLAQLFGAGLGNLATLVSRLIGSAIANIGLIAKKAMSGEGGNIIAGLYNGLLEAVAGIGQWLYDNLFVPFIEGFEGAFKIGSPSKVMSDEGGFIIAGLYDGISEKWKSIKAFFSGGIKGIVSTFKETDWKSSGSTIIEKVKGGASGAWSTISSFFSRKTTDTKEQFTRYNWKPAGTTIVSGVRSGAQSVWASKISEYFNSAIQGIKNKFLNSNWSPSGQKIITGIKSGITSKYSEVTSKMNDLVSAIKNKFNNTNWKTIGENICSGIKDGISKGWSWVTNKAKELAEGAYKAAKDKLDINSPSKLFRDKIGSSISEGMAVGIEEESDSVISAVRNLTNSITNTDVPKLEIPSIALGKVIPPETSKNIDTLNETMKTLMDVLKYTQTTAVTKDDLITVLNTLLPTMLQRYVSFYIGDEQIARHANAGNSKLDYRFNPVRS